MTQPPSPAPDFRTADLFDAHADELEVAEPLLRHFGGRRRFFGTIRTLSTFEDNSRVRTLLESPGEGSILVIDGAGSLRVALLGDRLGALAVDNGWSGIVINGCIRDADELAAMPLGVLALATCPARSRKDGRGQADVPVRFAGLTFSPGQWLYADTDGIVLSARQLHP